MVSELSPIFTAIEQRILDAFVDGSMDTRAAAPKLFPYSAGPMRLLAQHIVDIRKKIKRHALTFRIETPGHMGRYTRIEV